MEPSLFLLICPVRASTKSAKLVYVMRPLAALSIWFVNASSSCALKFTPCSITAVLNSERVTAPEDRRSILLKVRRKSMAPPPSRPERNKACTSFVPKLIMPGVIGCAQCKKSLNRITSPIPLCVCMPIFTASAFTPTFVNSKPSLFSTRRRPFKVITPLPSCVMQAKTQKIQKV